MSMKHRLGLDIKWTENYYSGEPNWPMIAPTDIDIEKYKGWCKERVGVNGWNYYGKHKKIPCQFGFKRSEDMLAFKLTFGL